MARYENRVRRLREQAGVSQKNLAGRAGLRPQTLSLIETGLARDWRRHAPAIARALGVAVAELETETADVTEIARAAALLSEPQQRAILQVIRVMMVKR